MPLLLPHVAPKVDSVMPFFLLFARFLEQKMVRARQVAGGPIAVRNASYASSKEILKHISELGITKVNLRLQRYIVSLSCGFTLLFYFITLFSNVKMHFFLLLLPKDEYSTLLISV